MPFVQLRLNGWRDREPGFLDAEAVQVLAWSGERDLEITGIRAEEWLIETVITHLVAHSAEAAAALLNAMEIGKTLGQYRIPRGRTVFPA